MPGTVTSILTLKDRLQYIGEKYDFLATTSGSTEFMSYINYLFDAIDVEEPLTQLYRYLPTLSGGIDRYRELWYLIEEYEDYGDLTTSWQITQTAMSGIRGNSSYYIDWFAEWGKDLESYFTYTGASDALWSGINNHPELDPTWSGVCADRIGQKIAWSQAWVDWQEDFLAHEASWHPTAVS